MATIRYPTHDAGASHPRVAVPPHYKEFGYMTSSMADAIARDLRTRGYEVEQRCISNPSAAPRRYGLHARTAHGGPVFVGTLPQYYDLIGVPLAQRRAAQ